MKNYFNNLIKTISNSVMSLDEANFKRLVDECVLTIERGNKIVVSGLGKNVPVCDKFVGTMNSLGQNAVFMNTNTAVHGDIGMVYDGDLVIILTKSGETEESIYLYTLLKLRKVNIWLLSFENGSTLYKAIGASNSIILDLEHEGDQWNIVPNNSTTVNLIILQGLAMHIVEKRGVRLSDFKKNHPGGHIGVQLQNV